MFDVIVRSNGSDDDATVALQLLSHLEGDALNVTLLVPEVKRATWAGLVGALTEHYGSPGRLADYRQQFERMTVQEGEELETRHLDSVSPKLPSETLLTAVGYGRATQTQASEGS